jgi:hypothetical protein
MAVPIVLDEDSRDWALRKAIAKASKQADFPIDIVSIGDKGTPGFGTQDAEVLAWASSVGRVVVTHDTSTMVSCFWETTYNCGTTTGLIIWRSSFPYTTIAETLVLIACCAAPSELYNSTTYIPYGDRS